MAVQGLHREATDPADLGTATPFEDGPLASGGLEEEAVRIAASRGLPEARVVVDE